MRRREFIIFLGGSAAIWPLGSQAQERNRRPKIGVILNYAETDPVGKSRFSAVEDQLGKLGWADANNVEIEVRWGRWQNRSNARLRIPICQPAGRCHHRQ
jgi:putative tryptophan/tyrosine transport system substrate-binding protein